MKYASNVLKIESMKIDSKELIFDYSVDEHVFRTEIFYEDVDFDKLIEKYSPEFIDNIVFHIALLEAMKFCSLAPRIFDLDKYSSFMTPETEPLFTLLFNKIFAQHKWENHLIRYSGPQLQYDAVDNRSDAVAIDVTKSRQTLFSCGGGKDSLVAMKLLETIGESFAVAQYSHSVYGKFEQQQELINDLVEHTGAKKQHRMIVLDDFLDSPTLSSHYKHKINTVCAPETPSGVFEMLPIMLAHGYQSLVVGHEKSADIGNFWWGDAEQEVNHQWGKSLSAEIELNAYIEHNLITNFRYYSILKPVYDLLIFQLLRKDERLIKHTQSCNVSKPWCKRCPKCAYVWLNFYAYLDGKLVDDLFQENLLEVPELKQTFRAMAGLAEHKPFECIGEIGETQLAMWVVGKKGVKSTIIDEVNSKLSDEKVLELIYHYTSVDVANHTIPTKIAQAVIPLFVQASKNAQKRLTAQLATSLKD